MNDLEIDLATQLAEALAEVTTLRHDNDKYGRDMNAVTGELFKAQAEVERLRAVIANQAAVRGDADREIEKLKAMLANDPEYDEELMRLRAENERLRDRLRKSRNKRKVAARSARNNAEGRRHAEAEIERLRAEVERLTVEIERYKADPTLLLAVDESKVIYFPEEEA